MSKIEVNTIEPQCGTTLTLGASGDTVTLASGASQSGFGRTGTVDWQTTKKTTSFTAANGEGYFVDTADSGAVTMTLPSSPSAGNIVAVKDYNGNFATANLTIARNGSPINGGAAADVVVDTNGASIVLVYVDATQGWVATQDDESTFSGKNFLVATGGTITTCGNCKIHTFTGPGTFTVSQVSSCAPENIVSYMVIAGGGGAGHSYPSSNAGGGGGAGGYRELKNPVTPYTASPLDGYPSSPNRVTVTATAFPITVGGGGSGHTPSGAGTAGSNSVFSTITSAGGGKGGANGPGTGSPSAATTGGSGGGGAGGTSDATLGGGAAGNTPSTTPAQGTDGGDNQKVASGSGTDNPAGGGGGAGAVGADGTPSAGGAGGAGVTSSINATPTARAGGGGAGGASNGAGGSGGGGCAGGGAGTANTGGGGSGTMNGNNGGTGGSGVVIIRYKFQ